MIRDESLYVATRFLLTFGCFTGSMSLRFQLVRHWEKMPTYQHTESIALMFSYIAVVIALWIKKPDRSLVVRVVIVMLIGVLQNSFVR